MANMLTDVFSPLTDILSHEAAEQILQIKMRDDFYSRLEILRERANNGTLSEAERSEYGDIVELLDWIGILRAKALKKLGRLGA